MDSNLSFLNTFSEISEDTYEKLLKLATFKTIKSGETVTKLNEIPTKMYFLVSGIMRAYINTEEGKEFNKKIFLPFSFAGCFTALLQNEPSIITCEAITDSDVYEVDFEAFNKLCNSNAQVKNLYISILERIFVEYEERQLDLISLDGTERYLKLRKQIPNVDKLIPQYQIASYLSITPVQLSRIRRKLKED